MCLKDDERIDYLLSDESMKIIQSPTIFSYSLDAVLLADFASIPIKRGNILDLCTGNGVIPLLLSHKTKATITGLEIQSRLVDMAKRNVTMNDLNEQITMLEGDLRERQSVLKQSYYDTVTCNPPYFPTPKKSEHNRIEYLTIARHEVCCQLEDVVKACKLYVKPGGKVALVHRPERLTDLLTLFRAYRIEPKRMQLIYPKYGKEANALLLEGIRDGRPGLKVATPLYVYNEQGDYTRAAKEIIYGK